MIRKHRRSRIQLVLTVLILLPSMPTQAGAAANAPTESTPDVLTMAVPTRLVPVDPKSRAVKRDELSQGVRRLLDDAYRSPSKDRSRGLRVNVVLGNDYEILDWLGKGLVDAAVVPSMSLYLLNRDRLDVREVGSTTPPAPSRDGNPPTADLSAAREWVWCLAVEAEYRERRAAGLESMRRSCGNRTSPGSASYEFVLTSHLATGGFVAPVSATAVWLRQKLNGMASAAPERRAMANRFWETWFDRARFTFDAPLPDAPAAPAGPIRIVFDPPSDRPSRFPSLPQLAPDHFVLVLRPATSALMAPTGRKPDPDALLGGLRATFEPKSDEDVPSAFRPLLFPEPYFDTRTFSFTIDESIRLLRLQRETRSDSVLALVLPGGGVKSAYQSTLVEHLYQAGRLRNHRAGGGPGGDALDVHHVIGTSGGALLGFFVAQLGERGPSHLSDLLWTKQMGHGVSPRTLDGSDLFGFWDLPRYVSFVTIFLMLWVPLGVWALSTSPRARGGPVRAWRLRLGIGIGLILALTPFVVRSVNGRAAQEHIPEVEGWAYAVFLVIALCADQCLIHDPHKSAWSSWRWRVIGWVLLGLGIVAMALPVAFLLWGGEVPWLTGEIRMPGKTTAINSGSLIACLGAVLALTGVIVGSSASPRYVWSGFREFGGAVVLGLLHIVVVYLALAAAIRLWPGRLSFLELTVDFWLGLLTISLIVGFVLWILARLGGRWWGRAVWVRARFDYLTGHHPSGSTRRFVRLLLGAWGAVVWWNIVVAPGLYGNAHARTVVTELEERFRAKAGARQLNTRLVVTANALERDGTRYFMFAPTKDDCVLPVRRSDGAKWGLFYFDSQAAQLTGSLYNCRADGNDRLTGWEFLKDVVFASGSPFPVFPAHEVDQEALVDGGYSSNVPLDAAQTVGATTVLLIESSSALGPSSPMPPRGPLDFRPGRLFRNASQLLGFLYERSQQLDRLSRADLLVVSLAPRRDEPNWPFLADFRATVVDHMRRVATRDLSHRIGTVQSWGQPRVAFTVDVERSSSQARRSAMTR